ncbi:MAG: TRAP transporter large permease subunit [Burkholderiales bacterium]|jgi:C4-dicarboxylate transporter, DctM subunit|nr:TRAP transporter large permease subunit [Burkholderiales bacterium]MDP4909479.1 TRAP transporter large permease subunit [Burkholderiaceae bacterium]MDP5111326.1 TRAP transporter large permease subunit [Burkholderiaceae bacterium]
MDVSTIGLIVAVIMLVLLASGVWVAVTLMSVGLISMLLFSHAPATTIQTTVIWGQSSSWALTALPLFIWMGEILYRTRLAKDMFEGLAPWLAGFPGRLIHINVVSCGIFAAVSGSSAATTATIGKITIPELLKRGYDEKTTIGSLAGSSTLGFLIPPSIIMIVYGVAADVSITRLFIAGILPGIMLMILFMGYLAIWSMLNPSKVPAREPRIPFLRRLRETAKLFPIVLLMIAVIGSIYLGIATATEAAAVGVVGALLIALFTGSMTKQNFIDSVLGATRTSVMVSFILAGAAFLSTAMGFTGIPRELSAWVGTLGLDKFELLLALTLLFIVLGCFLDGISIVVLTAAVIMPIIQQAGIDPIWFGIFIVVVIEMSQITPPVGINLFILQSMTGKNLWQVAVAAFPFFLLLVVATILLILFPQIATWLPDTIRK